jgi:transcriptional regulator with XRE-family HTH domain
MTVGSIKTQADWIAAVEARLSLLGWKQADLEYVTKIGDGYYSKLKSGKKTPTLETMNRINHAVGLELSVALVL